MKSLAILVAALIGIAASPIIAEAANTKKSKPKASTTERAAKGLLTCTKDCGLQHKEPEARARCIGIAQASGKCSSR